MNPQHPGNSSAPHAPAVARRGGWPWGWARPWTGALTLVLLAKGWTQGGAHIAGWLAGSLLWWLLAAWAGRGAAAGALPRASRVGWQVVAGVLALGLRGGVLASALAWGLPLWLAVALGVALAWGLRAVGE
jgi:hypothetical protein